MGRLGRELEEKRLRLLDLARRRSFESYMRYGRVPELYSHAAAFAMGAEKAVDPNWALPLGATGEPPPSSHYVWRTVRDERVRPTHAALDGLVFSRSNPPAIGHPGREINCRCWAEPYYGDPAIPDASLQLQRTVEDDATGTAPWSRIETLRRPDGSLVQSFIEGRDGTRFLSLFSGAHVAHLIVPASGEAVRLETSNGVQTAYLGEGSTSPLLQTAWTANGPKVTRARRRVAFLLDDPSDPNSIIDGFDPDLDPDALVDPSSVLSLVGPAPNSGLGALSLGLLSLHLMQQDAPARLGVGADEEPFILFKAWESDGEAGATPIMVDALTAEQVLRSCKRLPEVQAWTDEAAAALASERLVMNPTRWGTAVHKLLKDMIEAMKDESPLAFGDIQAELSLDESDDDVHYGQSGSTRLDILEDRRDDMGAICVYDIKTGRRGLTPRRIEQIAKVVYVVYGGVMFYIIEVRPNQ
jgi:hypothetical protein